MSNWRTAFLLHTLDPIMPLLKIFNDFHFPKRHIVIHLIETVIRVGEEEMTERRSKPATFLYSQKLQYIGRHIGLQ